ncbi:MAG TPA: AAA family ATPase [Parachlamydiaceae bacterium]|nr:AAA family ATPase [Parachlamydiaceae bacterium]
MSKKNAIFIAATGQNVGKSTLCLGIIAGLKKRHKSVGFIKPIGQQHVQVDANTIVDKDVVLFKNHFQLKANWHDMSPVIIPTGFTRDYLDEKISEKHLKEEIKKSFEKISSENAFTVAEGTGHIGVGSIIDLNNAKVAKRLGLDVVMIASGGLGSSFDELCLNIALAEQYGVKIRGVILNRVLESKREMIQEYFPKALKRWNIPLLGLIPFNDLLNTPAIEDFETLFNAPLISGKEYHYRHFQNPRLVAGSLESYQEEIKPNELIITPASREDIINKTLEKHAEAKKKNGIDLEGGMILTGRQAPSGSMIKLIKAHDIPVLYAPICSYDAMKMITSFIAKIRTGDKVKIERAISLVEENLNFDALTCR